MECLRCSKKTEGLNVFCPECLEEMEKHPVKPGTVVHIPHRQETELPRRKKEPTIEEQLAMTEKKIENLQRWLILMTTAAMLLGTLLYFSVALEYQSQPENSKTRNYTVVQSVE